MRETNLKRISVGLVVVVFWRQPGLLLQWAICSACLIWCTIDDTSFQNRGYSISGEFFVLSVMMHFAKNNA